MTGFPLLTLDRTHERLSEMTLAETVPEDVRGYFETVKNICLYARYVYAFYAVARGLTYPLIELALRKRLRPAEVRQGVYFRKLLNEAIACGLIKEEGFSHIRRIREEQVQLREIFGEPHPPQIPLATEDYVKILSQVLPRLRNSFAHPKHLSIHLPGDALFAIRFAVEFINQLYMNELR